jgi:putative FmdB family regulatory protein
VPLYEYQCQQCQHRFEKIQSFSAAPETVCPKCGGVLEKLISAPAIQFKGAGWYVSDYSAKGAASKKAFTAESGGGDSGAATSPSTNGDSTAASKKGGDSTAATTTANAATTTASPAKTT